MKRIHVGCGKRYIPGWTHVDLVRHPHVDLVAPAHDLHALADGCAEIVYACHVLEHMRREEYLRALREFHRVFVPGGTLRVAVPDLHEWCSLYLETRQIAVAHGSIFGRQDYEENTHYQGFDFDKLARDLYSTGFSDVCRYDWRLTDHAAFDDLSQTYIPHMDKEHGRLMSLNVEARA